MYLINIKINERWNSDLHLVKEILLQHGTIESIVKVSFMPPL